MMAKIHDNAVNKNVFFLHKGPLSLDSRFAEHLQGKLEILSSLFSMKAGKSGCHEIRMRVSNTGSSVWLTHSKADIRVVSLGVHLLNQHNQILSFDWRRIKLSRQLDPSDTIIQEIKIDFPDDQSGHVRLRFDLVSELVCWFEQLGHSPPQSELLVF